MSVSQIAESRHQTFQRVGVAATCILLTSGWTITRPRLNWIPCGALVAAGGSFWWAERALAEVKEPKYPRIKGLKKWGRGLIALQALSMFGVGLAVWKRSPLVRFPFSLLMGSFGAMITLQGEIARNRHLSKCSQEHRATTAVWHPKKTTEADLPKLIEPPVHSRLRILKLDVLTVDLSGLTALKELEVRKLWTGSPLPASLQELKVPTWAGNSYPPSLSSIHYTDPNPSCFKPVEHLLRLRTITLEKSGQAITTTSLFWMLKPSSVEKVVCHGFVFRDSGTIGHFQRNHISFLGEKDKEITDPNEMKGKITIKRLRPRG